MWELPIIQRTNADVLVIGGGAAGLRAAIAARRHSLNVLLISESPIGFRNNSAISKATLAATGIWKESSDSPEVHLKDTIAGGRFINDRKLVAKMTQVVRQQVHNLMEFGVNFRQRDGELLVRQSPGHTYPRHLTAEAYKGINITRPMRQHAVSIGIKFLEGILVTKLLQAGETVVGVLGIDNKGQVLIVGAKSTILATGGAGRIYLRTNNAIGITGDGYALAYKSGAILRDMEFVQFYPTASGKEGSKLRLYERIIPMGGILRNSLGEDILKKHGMEIDTLTRDRLARAIVHEVIESRGVDGKIIFDLASIPDKKAEELYHNGLISKEKRLLVAPTVHFFMGGIRINEKAEAGIDGLYAAGEVCGGIHGANRLGGNALAEAFAFGTIAGNEAATSSAKREKIPIPQSGITNGLAMLKELSSGAGQKTLVHLRESLRQTMWDKVGVIRDEYNLENTLKEILSLREQLRKVSLTDNKELPQAVKVDNMLTVSEIICRAALMRTESRGAHYRVDYPDENDSQWLKTIEIYQDSGKMMLKPTPVQSEAQ